MSVHPSQLLPFPVPGDAGAKAQSVTPVPSPASRIGRTRPGTLLRRFTLIASLIALASFVLAGVFYSCLAWEIARVPSAPLASNPLRYGGMPYRSVTFHSLSTRGATLHGWYIPGGSAKTIVFSHGYGGNREEIWVPLYDLAEAAHQRHYNVLMFDYSYTTGSHPFTGGVREAKELLGAVRYARSEGAGQVFVWGFSMGAGTALQAELQDKNSTINGMILDSTFVLRPTTLYHNLKRMYHVPQYPSRWLMNPLMLVLDGFEWSRIPYKKVLTTHYAIPLFLIHGTADAKAPYALAEQIANNQKGNPLSRFWLSPGSIHELVYRSHPKTYIARSFAFLSRVSQAGSGTGLLASGTGSGTPSA